MMSCKMKWHFLPRMEYKAQVKLDNLNNRVIDDQYKNELGVKLRSLCRSMETNFEKDWAQAEKNDYRRTQINYTPASKKRCSSTFVNESNNNSCSLVSQSIS